MINRTDPVSSTIEKAAIEKIMAKRMNPRKRENEYLVKWETKPQTWEPASHLETCKDLIDNFEILLAKQKEMRSKSQFSQQHQATPIVTSTPTTPSIPNRPERSSKQKAINQVKQWTGGNKHHDDTAEASGKRKIEDEDEYDEEMDGDDVDDEDYELESSWEKKKMAQQLGQTSVKRIRTESAAVQEALIKAGQSGNVRIMQVNKTTGTASNVTIQKNMNGSPTQVGSTVVRKVVGTKSPDVIVAGQKQQSGVFKKAITTGTVITKKPGEGQVRIVDKSDQIQSGIVRVNQTGGTPKPVVTRVVAKPSPTQVRPSPAVNVVRTVQSNQNQQKTLAQKIMQRSPINKGGTPGTTPTNARVVPRPGGTQVVQRSGSAAPLARKTLTPQQGIRRPGQQITPGNRFAKKGTPASKFDDDDDGIPDPFPEDLPPIDTNRQSPPPPLTLCPITGKVLGQAEGEPEPSTEEQQEESDASDQQQITQFLTNEDGSPIFITGDDGTIYQVAGKNAKGETILISTGADGEQTCVLLSADQDLLAGLPGIQTEDATQSTAEEGTPMTVDAAVAEAVSAGEQPSEEQQFFMKEGDENSQTSGGEEVTQPLSIAVGGGESGDSQDGQVTAEIVQADEPSPGNQTKII